MNSCRIICQIILMFIYQCRSQYIYDYEASYPLEREVQLRRYENYEIINPHKKGKRRHVKKFCSSSNSCDDDSESTDESKCACNDCRHPKLCCKDYCKEILPNPKYPGTYADNFMSTPYPNQQPSPNQQPFSTQSQSNMMIIPYPVPILIFPLKKPSKGTNTPISTKVETTSEISTEGTTRNLTSGTTGKSSATTDTTSTATDKTSIATEKSSTVTKEITKLTEETQTTTEKKITNTEESTVTPTPPTQKIHKKLKTRTTSTLQKHNRDPLGGLSGPWTKPVDILELLASKSSNIVNNNSTSSEYYDYPETVLKQKINDSRCSTDSNCYVRNWNNAKEPVNLYLEVKSSLRPILRLRPTISKPSQKTFGSKYMNSMVGFPKHRLRALNDKFAKMLIENLKNKKVLLLENNI